MSFRDERKFLVRERGGQIAEITVSEMEMVAGLVNTVVAGTGITVNITDPANPIVTNSAPYTAPTGTGFAHVTGGVLDAAAVAETGTGNAVRANAPTFDGNVTLASGIKMRVISTGAAPVTGNATMVNGTVTVNTTAALTGSMILINRKTSGGTPGATITYTINNGVSFTINSSGVIDASTFTWYIIDSY